MNERPAILKAVEQLGYRVTVGDVAVQSGLELERAQQGLVALASDAGGHLQVSETGEIVYLFPESLRTVLLNKFWKLRVKESLGKVWQVSFYLIRISFGVLLILSILLMLVAIVILIIAVNSQQGEKEKKRDSDGFGLDFLFRSNNLWNLWYIFHFSDHHRGARYSGNFSQNKKQKKKSKHQGKGSGSDLNFLEAIFSFLFGDGNPNADLEERRWQSIGSIIRNHDGAIVAEQVAPYLNAVSSPNQDSEDYVLPVLLRFNGYPEVADNGGIVYYFPELQVMAKEAEDKRVSPYLEEARWEFSQAGKGQLFLSIGLGCFNLLLAIVLGILLQGEAIEELGGYLGFVQSIYWILLIYALGFLGIPLLRFFVIQSRNLGVEVRNRKRQAQAEILRDPDPDLQQKITYARQFGAKQIIGAKDIAYSTEEDLLNQEVDRSEQVDRDWEKRL
ncbi:MAG: hypothetical protein ACO37W_14305 [Prochlorotrichaceae cyanobacterium]